MLAMHASEGYHVAMLGDEYARFAWVGLLGLSLAACEGGSAGDGTAGTAGTDGGSGGRGAVGGGGTASGSGGASGSSSAGRGSGGTAGGSGTTGGASGTTGGSGDATGGASGATGGSDGSSAGSAGTTGGTGGTSGDGGTAGGSGANGGEAGAGSGTPSTERCTDAALEWKSANKTNYTSYPDPGSQECIEFNGCMWEGLFAACNDKKSEAWVSEHDIVAAFPDFDSLELHDLCLRKGDKLLVVTVLDTCGDSDCDGCCTENQGSADQLIDIESYTNERWGVGDGPIEWADLGPTTGTGCD